MTTKSQIEDKTVFSTCLIGDNAKAGEELSLFTTPQGQYMPQIPYDANRCEKCNHPARRLLKDTDTNIIQAGQLGSTIGDARFDRIRAQLVEGGDPISLDATVELRVGGRKMLSIALDKLVRDWVPIEGYVMAMKGRQPVEMPAPYCLVPRTDTVEARLRLNRETKIAGAALVVRLSIEGKFITEHRLSGTPEGLASLVNDAGV